MISCVGNLLLFFLNAYFKNFLLILTIFFTIFTLNLFPNVKCNSFKARTENETATNVSILNDILKEFIDKNTPNSSHFESSFRQFRAQLPLHHSSKTILFCENNGTFINGKCHCFYPYVGVRCTDFACEHGLSVGPRYDPENVFFNRKCICDEDWAGDLCNIPIADQCNERGQYINGRCKCHGYYFGPKCQYVGKCINGKLTEGVCFCHYGYEGDYCDKIVCHHGYPDKSNDSNNCVCPPRHIGMFCDECLLTGDYILPFPNCTEERIPYRARVSREKTNDRILARLFIIILTLVVLAMLMIAMFLMNWGRKRATTLQKNEKILIGKQEIMQERRKLLERVIFLQSNANCLVAENIGSINANNLNGTRRGSRFIERNRFDALI